MTHKDTTGRTIFQETGDPVLVALAKGCLYFMTWTWRAWRGAVFEYHKARKRSLPFHARIAVDDPLLSRVDDKNNPNPDDSIPQDEPQFDLYRTEGGTYFTESMMKNPSPALIKALTGSRITEAADISDERAFEICEQLDALELDTELTDNEKLMRQSMKAHLAGLSVR